MRNIAFRVDASAKIGSGHVMRCLTLAEALRSAGATVTFICRGRAANQIRRQGFEVALLPWRKAPRKDPRPPYGTWLGATSKQDAADTVKAIGQSPVDLLIVDHYGIGAKWHKRLRAHAKSIMAIDDLADRKYDCDLLLDQSALGKGEERYASRVPRGCKVLLGPKFALLRPEFKKVRSMGCMWDEQVHKIFVSFGGSDTTNETGKTLAVASSLHLSLRVIAVVGESNRRYSMLQRRFGKTRGVSLVKNPPSMADAMLHTDLAIGAPGMTTWERACLGIPSVLLALAENQEGIGRAMQGAEAALYLGCARDVTEEDLARAITGLILAPDVRCRMAAEGMRLSDGLGVERVMAEIRGRSTT